MIDFNDLKITNPFTGELIYLKDIDYINYHPIRERL